MGIGAGAGTLFTHRNYKENATTRASAETMARLSVERILPTITIEKKSIQPKKPSTLFKSKNRLWPVKPSGSRKKGDTQEGVVSSRRSLRDKGPRRSR